jgi:hypothetical protein
MMKKIITLLLLTCMLSACNNHKPPGNKNTANQVEADEDNNGGATEKLVLNNDIKWKVDSPTNSNVNDLLQIVNKFDATPDKSLEAYTKAQFDLQQGINKMIAECKMKGPDHEALHKWLKPLIDKVAYLKKAMTVKDAAEAYKVVKSQLDLYGQYFEL